MRKLLALSLILTAVAAATTLACSDDSDSSDGLELTAEEQAMYCKDVAATRASLETVSTAIAKADSTALKNATANVRTSADTLNRWGRELEGGDNSLANLDQNITELETLVASPDLNSVQAELQPQVDAISKDLDDLAATGDCP